MTDATASEDDAVEERVRTAAAAAGLPFEVIDCDPTLADTAAFCAAYGYALEDSANCVVVVGLAARGPQNGVAEEFADPHGRP